MDLACIKDFTRGTANIGLGNHWTGMGKSSISTRTRSPIEPWPVMGLNFAKMILFLRSFSAIICLIAILFIETTFNSVDNFRGGARCHIEFWCGGIDDESYYFGESEVGHSRGEAPVATENLHEHLTLCRAHFRERVLTPCQLRDNYCCTLLGNPKAGRRELDNHLTDRFVPQYRREAHDIAVCPDEVEVAQACEFENAAGVFH